MKLLSRLVDTDSLLATDRTDNGTIESAIIDIFLAYNLGLFGSFSNRTRLQRGDQ